jgi:thioredoxin-like negative regulator of GroEL
MSGLLYLSEKDFKSIPVKDGNLLCNNIKGISLILFYSTQCKFCATSLPIFKTLPGTLTGCQFGIVNISISKELVGMSRQSTSPLQYVPFIILYFEGKPIMSYDGPHDINEIRKFVITVTKDLQQKQLFMAKQTNATATEMKDNTFGSMSKLQKKIPDYTTGHPLYGNKVCYLENEKCYQK